MAYLKERIIALVILLFSIAMIYYGWYQLREEGEYSLRMAAFAPLGAVGGLFLLVFPSMFGKPNTTKERIVVMIVFALGIIAGLVNWFLMDPGFFGW